MTPDKSAVQAEREVEGSTPMDGCLSGARDSDGQSKRRSSPRTGRAAGFTLIEVMISSAILLLVVSGTMVCYLWCGQQASLSVKTGWSNDQAMRTSGKLIEFIRNAREIRAIDVAEGMWVELVTASGTVVRLAYSNAVAQLRDGRMYLHRTNGTDLIVARGLTEIMSVDGNTEPVFYADPQNLSSNVLYISFRVAEPTSSGQRDADDDDFAVCVRFAAYLRNAANTSP